MNKLFFVKKLALSYGADDLYPSNRKNKKYAVLYNGKIIHYGDSRYQDYIDHKNNERKKQYLARATNIRNSNGKLTYLDKSSPNFWSVFTLWNEQM